MLVLVFVAEDVPVLDDELVIVAVSELVLVVLLVEEEEAVWLLVTDGDGDEERLRMLAMLRPRKVMLATAPSASPTSHSVDSSTPLENALLGMSCVMFTYKKQLAVPVAVMRNSLATNA